MRVAGEMAAFLRGQIGESFTSDWITVDQHLIDQFADATRDWNFMHVDPQRAGETEFGGTIAHGFLILSLLAPLRGDSGRPAIPGLRVGLNYGFERVRFIAPVRSGSRIRAVFTISEVNEEKPGQVREAMDVTVEIEGEERPAAAARWLTVYLA